MINIEAMRERGRAKVERKAIKTFLTDEAQERLRAVSEYTGAHIYQLIEELILTQLPVPPETLEGEAQ